MRHIVSVNSCTSAKAAAAGTPLHCLACPSWLAGYVPGAVPPASCCPHDCKSGSARWPQGCPSCCHPPAHWDLCNGLSSVILHMLTCCYNDKPAQQKGSKQLWSSQPVQRCLLVVAMLNASHPLQHTVGTARQGMPPSVVPHLWHRLVPYLGQKDSVAFICLLSFLKHSQLLCALWMGCLAVNERPTQRPGIRLKRPHIVTEHNDLQAHISGPFRQPLLGQQ